MSRSFTPINGRHEMSRHLLGCRQGLHCGVLCSQLRRGPCSSQSAASQCSHSQRECCFSMNSSKFVLLLFAAGFGFGYLMESNGQESQRRAGGSSSAPHWLRDLDPRYQDLVGVMRAKGYGIVENAAVCKQQDVVGYYTWGQHAIKVCTDRIARLNADPWAFRTLLQQTIAHEATHVAQSCRQAREGKTGLGLAAARLYGLPQSVRADIQKSIASNQSSNPRSLQWRIEAEAMALEETPDQVIGALQQFCR